MLKRELAVAMDVISALVALVLTAVVVTSIEVDAMCLQVVYHPILLIQMNDEGF